MKKATPYYQCSVMEKKTLHGAFDIVTGHLSMFTDFRFWPFWGRGRKLQVQKIPFYPISRFDGVKTCKHWFLGQFLKFEASLWSLWFFVSMFLCSYVSFVPWFFLFWLFFFSMFQCSPFFCTFFSFQCFFVSMFHVSLYLGFFGLMFLCFFVLMVLCFFV